MSTAARWTAVVRFDDEEDALQAALATSPAADPAEAERRLVAVEGLLGEALAVADLEPSTAAKLVALRGELSSSLSAASTLRSLDLDARAVALLERATAALRSGLEDDRSIEGHLAGQLRRPPAED